MFGHIEAFRHKVNQFCIQPVIDYLVLEEEPVFLCGFVSLRCLEEVNQERFVERTGLRIGKELPDDRVRVITENKHLDLIGTNAESGLLVGFAHEPVREHLLPHLFPEVLCHLLINLICP